MALKVLIVGGGVAGPSLAYWLSYLNTEVTLIERFPKIRAHGQQVDIRGQGVSMMKKMGIEAAIRAAAVHEPGMQLINKDGKTMAYFPSTTTDSTQQSFTSEFEIMRGDLVNILYDLTKNKTNVQHFFNTSIESFTQEDENKPGGKVHVVLSDGREEDFDLVVGADGSGSQVRKMMLGPDASDPRYSLNAHIGYFSISSVPGDSKNWTLCHLPGRRVIGTRQDKPGFLRIYMIVHGEKPALEAAHKSGNLGELKNAWEALYKDGGWETERFMDGLKHSTLADDLYSTRLDEIRLPAGSWSRGRIVLLGDAAHCQTVNGQGVTLGMVGAYVLAGEIASLARRKEVSLAEAVVLGAKGYEQRFRPMACQTQGNSFGLGLFFPQTRFGIGILHTIAGWAASFGYGQTGGTGMDRKVSWMIPDYPELDGGRQQ